MKRSLKDSLFLGRKFKKEFKRQLRMIIVFTLGFTIAFTWRETIYQLSQTFVNFLLHFENPSASSIATSIFITVFSLVLIYITSRCLRDSYENY